MPFTCWVVLFYNIHRYHPSASNSIAFTGYFHRCIILFPKLRSPERGQTAAHENAHPLARVSHYFRIFIYTTLFSFLQRRSFETERTYVPDQRLTTAKNKNGVPMEELNGNHLGEQKSLSDMNVKDIIVRSTRESY